MCPPTYFQVSYAINPWMDPARPVDRDLALGQWAGLAATYQSFGHRVDLLDPVPDLPDMVYAANGATVLDGRVLTARFANPERTAEAARHADWHQRTGILYGGGEVTVPVAINEAEGDFAILSRTVLAGYGFRTSRAAHAELAALTRRTVVSLELVDPRFYHLDMALTVLDDQQDHVAYYPAAFSPASRRLLAERFPTAILADEPDAYAFGLNCVSDGLNVFIPAGAIGLRVGDRRRAATVPARSSWGELAKGGGSVKCCTQEIRTRVDGGS